MAESGTAAEISAHMGVGACDRAQGGDSQRDSRHAAGRPPAPAARRSVSDPERRVRHIAAADQHPMRPLSSAATVAPPPPGSCRFLLGGATSPPAPGGLRAHFTPFSANGPTAQDAERSPYAHVAHAAASRDTSGPSWSGPRSNTSDVTRTSEGPARPICKAAARRPPTAAPNKPVGSRLSPPILGSLRRRST